MIDLALTEDDVTGKTIAHRFDCPVVLEHLLADRPVMKLFGVAEPLPIDMRLHGCLKERGGDG